MADEAPRLAELLGSLSLATDLAAGLGSETALRTALVAVRIGAAAGIQGFELRDVYYTGVLRFIGCTAFSHEMSSRYGAGDDLGIMRALTPADSTHAVDVLSRALGGINPKAGVLGRARAFAKIASDPRAGHKLAEAHCDLAVRLAARLGMPQGVIDALGQAYERWDGKGSAFGIEGDAIRPCARVLHVAWRVAAHFGLEGARQAAEILSARSGSEFDPRLCAVAEDAFADVVLGLDEGSVWERYLDAEPRPWLRVPAARVTDVALAFAQYVDVKSPYTLGHSTGVADLAKAAAAVANWSAAETNDVYVAALLHDVGRVAVPNGIWDKPGKLGAIERDTMRTHAFYTERILARSPLLAAHAKVASLDHERLDGSGYHRGMPASTLDRASRVLAAADVYRALSEDRAYRSALPPDRAAKVLSDEAASGRLCREAVGHVLAAAGHAASRRRSAWPASLSDREVDVLRLVARGLANKEIAERLSISHKTVMRHMESIFDKTRVRTRAAAAVFAVDHELA